MTRTILALACAVSCFAAVSVATATASTDRSAQATQLRHANNVLAFFANPNHLWLQAPKQEKCWNVPWQRSCRIARVLVRDFTTQRDRLRKQMWYALPEVNDWQVAVRVAQRAYPGTADWMLAISDREGGWGPWVWYGGRRWAGYHVGDDYLGMDTVGGWMQFRFSTFAPYWRGAQKDLRQRGFAIPGIQMPPEGGPSQYAAWLSPLGQALTAGYMRYYGKDSCHWCL